MDHEAGILSLFHLSANWGCLISTTPIIPDPSRFTHNLPALVFKWQQIGFEVMCDYRRLSMLQII
ncbi:hypothetical protein [Mucilaginibacter sp.]|uniref:hypothetical protein n=1 Tax=Mucilaginibacter sp. TaxID=1882438 RepID=UPI00261E86A1|nr:hypothetical protein [Mucilaginibacter sp.]